LPNRFKLYNKPCSYIDYFVRLAKEAEAMGSDSLCIKDMAGILLPNDAYELITKLKSTLKFQSISIVMQLQVLWMPPI
jgi:pyruvate/oxaloacetate carboxyltransferase